MSPKVRLAVKTALEALRYGGVGEDRPHNRLILFLEAERSKCRGDDWHYWNYLSEKIQAAELLLTEAVHEMAKSEDGVTCNKCHNYLPGHATGGADICTCV